MAILRWNKLVGQERVKSIVDGAFQSGTLGHAYLFCGERGVGKFAAAFDLAMAALCTHPEARPCGVCAACKKVAVYAHPDFHVVMPLVFGTEHKKRGNDGGEEIAEKGWQFIAKSTIDRLNDPYKLSHDVKPPYIPVDWIREANLAIRRGATEGAFNAVIIDGVDTMKKESANAMLKTLEEPPVGTIMILLTNRASAVLPTVLSRCQTVRFAPLPHDVVCAELSRRFGVDASDSRVTAASMSGSIGTAIEEFENPRSEYFKTAAELWNECFRGNFDTASKSAERISVGKEAFSECQNVLKCMVELLRFSILSKLDTPINYFNDELDKIELPRAATPNTVESFVKLCREAIIDLNARGNAMLVMVTFVCTLMEMLNVQEQ